MISTRRGGVLFGKIDPQSISYPSVSLRAGSLFLGDYARGETMEEINALNSKLNLPPGTIKGWVDDGKLTEIDGEVDGSAASTLKQMEVLTVELATAQKAVAEIQTAVNALPDGFSKSPPRHQFWLPLLAAGGAVLVAIWGVCVAQSQLDTANATLRSQTSYQVQSDFLDLFEKLSNPDLKGPQVEGLLTIYDERIRMASEMSTAELATFEAEFWGSYSSSICGSWKEAYCKDGGSLYPRVVAKDYPGITEMCWKTEPEKDRCVGE